MEEIIDYVVSKKIEGFRKTADFYVMADLFDGKIPNTSIKEEYEAFFMPTMEDIKEISRSSPEMLAYFVVSSGKENLKDLLDEMKGSAYLKKIRKKTRKIFNYDERLDELAEKVKEVDKRLNEELVQDATYELLGRKMNSEEMNVNMEQIKQIFNPFRIFIDSFRKTTEEIYLISLNSDYEDLDFAFNKEWEKSSPDFLYENMECIVNEKIENSCGVGGAQYKMKIRDVLRITNMVGDLLEGIEFIPEVELYKVRLSNNNA